MGAVYQDRAPGLDREVSTKLFTTSSSASTGVWGESGPQVPGGPGICLDLFGWMENDGKYISMMEDSEDDHHHHHRAFPHDLNETLQKEVVSKARLLQTSKLDDWMNTSG